MSPRERDDKQAPADAEPDAAERDAAEPGAVEPAGELDAPDVPAAADAEQPEPPEQEPGEKPEEKRKIVPTRASGLWAGVIIAAIVLIFLLVFILQNIESVEIHFLTFSGSVPIGVALLLAAIAGILMVAIPGIARMIQLRRHAKR